MERGVMGMLGALLAALFTACQAGDVPASEEPSASETRPMEQYVTAGGPTDFGQQVLPSGTKPADLVGVLPVAASLGSAPASRPVARSAAPAGGAPFAAGSAVLPGRSTATLPGLPASERTAGQQALAAQRWHQLAATPLGASPGSSPTSAAAGRRVQP